MIQVTLDPSLLTTVSSIEAKICEIALRINSVSYKKEEGDPENVFGNIKSISKLLLPWHWDNASHIRIRWISNKELHGNPVDIDLTGFQSTTDKDMVQNFNEDTMFSEILKDYKESDKDPTKIYEVLMNKIKENHDFTSGIIHETTISDDYENSKDGFLPIFIAKASQELPPLSQYLKLVFFGTKTDVITISNEVDSFIAFPVFLGEEPNIWKPTNDENKKNDTTYEIPYHDFGERTIKAYCPITPLPTAVTEQDLKSPGIHLRDENGDFLGCVKLQVNDIEDQLPTILYEVGRTFDLPKILISWLEKEGSEEDPKLENKHIKSLDNILWACLRDSLGFGFKQESDQESSVSRIVKKYCKDYPISETNGMSLNELFWKQYFEINALMDKDGEKEFFKSSDKYSIDKWKDLFKIIDPEKFETIDNFTVNLGWIQSNLKKSFANELELVLLDDKTIKTIRSVWDFQIEKGHENWLKDWKAFIEIIQTDAVLQNRLVFLQWKDLLLSTVELKEIDVSSKLLDLQNAYSIDISETKQRESTLEILNRLRWYEQTLAETGEVRELQKESILTLYKEPFITQINYPLVEKNLIQSSFDFLKRYIEERCDTALNKTFFPKVENTDINEIYIEFIQSIVYDPALEHSDKSKIQLEIEAAILSVLEVIYPVPPTIQLKIDSLKVKALEEDDLNDEISGHIVLARRADEIGIGASKFTKSFHYLNSVEVQPVSDTGEKKEKLTDPYIAPVFLPESNGNKNAFLQISNEKISLVAGHETNDDLDTKDDKYAHLDYLFDDNQKAYAFWYGYQYQFLGFVALNSGVLPKAIRKDKATWNVHTTDEARLTSLAIDEKHVEEFIEEYTHLRRVPVSKVRIEAKGINDKTAPLPVPKGLFPLAFEMPKWEENKKKQGNDIVHYLLGDGENFKQNKIQLTIRKPTTPYWNWYAWQGENGKKRENDDPAKPSIAERALEKELEIRERATDPTKKTFDNEEHLLDPAVNSQFLITIQKIFPVLEKEPDLTIIKAKDLFKWENDNSGLKNVSQNLTIEIGSSTILEVEKAKLSVKAGEIVLINVRCLIEKSLFQAETRKFHSWMHNVISPKDELISIDGKDYYLTQSQQIWFEAAATKEIFLPDGTKENERKEALKKVIKDLNEKLWKNLLVTQKEGNEDDAKDKVFLKIRKEQPDFDYDKFAYTSRTEIRHQVWYWNGRLDESQLLLKNDRSDIVDLDPKNQNVTNAMLWEAWAFSDRPDFSALVQETNLTAYVPPLSEDGGPVLQLMFSDYRPGEKKALYYRFSATLYSRYELFGKEYKFSIESQMPITEDPKDKRDNKYDRWKRHIKKYDNADNGMLPKPSIRFVLPLTKSIQECSNTDTISGSSLLVVLDDRWFTEAGLAEQFELGIEVAKNPGNKEEGYLSLGNDPILTGKSLSSLKVKDNQAANETGSKYPYRESHGGRDMMVFDAKGPAGLTFDFAAQTPRLKGCAFVVEIPDLSTLMNEIKKDDEIKQTNTLHAWSMIEISVRRAIRPPFCQNQVAAKQQISEWTAKQWVQFLPSVDSFIPQAWKKAVSLNNSLSVKILAQANVPPSFTIEEGNKLPDFDPIFEDLHERFLIITERVYDIGGQPCERYVGTYHYKNNNNTITFSLNHPDDPKLQSIKEGFIRIIVVRKPRNYAGAYADRDIWTHLFGDNVNEKPNLTKVQNDPTAALPLVSERIPYRID